MTTKQMNKVKQGNILIAEFMGLSVVPDYPETSRDLEHHEVYEGSLYYNTKWSELMPVVEKIRDFKVQDGERITIMSSIHIHITSTGYEWHCSILGSITFCYTEQIPHNYTKIDVPHISLKGKTKRSQPIEPVYAAVIEFITWYNTQSK